MNSINMEIGFDLVVDTVLSNKSDIFVLQGGLIDRKHGAIQKSVSVLIINERKQVKSAFKAFRRNTDIIVHEQHMRSIASKSGQHTTGKTARAAGVGVGDNRHPLIAQIFRIKSAPVVDNIHVKRFRNRLIAPEHFPLNSLNVGNDEFLFSKSRGAERQPHRANGRFFNLSEEPRTANE